MAIAIDGSSPSSVNGNAGTTALTTASFNPPANSWIVAIACADNDTTATASISDSQSNTYTMQTRSNSSGGTTEVWSYYCGGGATGLTVTSTFTGAFNYASSGLLTVLVLTSASPTQPGATNTNAAATIALTPNALNSLVIGGTISNTSSFTPTANANSTLVHGVNGGGGGFSLASWYASSLTSSLSSTTYGISNGAGSCNSGAVEFLYLAPTAPILQTNPVTNVTPTTATANGSVNSDGGDTVTERGFVWSTSPNPTTSDSKVTASGTTGSYNASLTSLTSGTLYHVRAYATNAVGTDYGRDVTFQNLGTSIHWVKA